MNSELFSRLWRTILILALQVLILNHVHLFGYATPLVIVAILLSVPRNADRIPTLLYAFVVGLILDAFSNTLGVSAGALTFAAFIQSPLLEALSTKDSAEDMIPSFSKLGKWKFTSYIAILMAVYHIVFFAAESFSFFNITDQLISLLSSYALSMIVVLPLARRR